MSELKPIWKTILIILACAITMVALFATLTKPAPAEASTLVLPRTPVSIEIVMPPATTTPPEPVATEAAVETVEPDPVPESPACPDSVTSVAYAGLTAPVTCVVPIDANYAYYHVNERQITVELHDEMTDEVFAYTTSHERMHEWDFTALLASDRDQIMARLAWPDWNIEVWAETANRCERPEDAEGMGPAGWFFGQYNELLVTYTDAYGGSPTQDTCDWLFAAGMLPERVS